ncbi:galactose-3-O-sulfotransferase 2-like [Pecten maximus]|uniref:galactose-3-O-sulfotransferase 2-like n=1 Tax=Pecten maximus TaxID=6579 RepID=UPI0014590BB1|nr:galactose-3-O-sulfotransferase 2-like [Pecten maximus]
MTLKGKKETTNQIRYSIKGAPVQHIAFLKVHKAASTSIQNIFLRYGHEHNLVFALPKGKDPAGVQSLTPHAIFPIPTNRTIDIFCAHVRFNRNDFIRMLPKDTVYIGIVREPFSQFKSNIQFLREKQWIQIPNKKISVSEYLSRNEKYVKSRGRVRRPVTYNAMAHDFGFPFDLFWKTDYNAIQDHLLRLNEEFDIVLVLEYLDESIVLMRRLLNWDLKYVLYGKLNVLKNPDKDLNFGPNEEKLYQNWAKLDYALYYFFLQKYKERLRAQSPDFFEEVAYFRETRFRYDHFCTNLIASKNDENVMLFEGSRWNRPFVVTKEDCGKLYIHDVDFLEILKRKHLKLANI